METLPKLLNRIAIEYLDKKTQNYVGQLELIANIAQKVIEDKSNFEELKKALDELEKVA
jgi:hypothetical protein